MVPRVVADALSRLSPQPKDKNEEEDLISVHMLTDEIPTDSARVADFRSATAEDTTSGLLMPVVANGCPCRVKKRLSSIISGIQDVQRGDQCRKQFAFQGT